MLERFAPDGRGKLYEQLARLLKRAIVDGHFQAGERLPSTRVLAESFGLSRNTVLMAYEILRAGQLTVSRERGRIRVADIPRSRRVVTRLRPAAPQSRYTARARKLGPDTPGGLRRGLRYDLRCEPPADLELMSAWGRKLAVAARFVGSRYPDPQGFLPLRIAIAEYLSRRLGVECNESDILIVSGAQQAVTLTARTVLDEGDTVVLEDPHYICMAQTLSAHGAHIVSVATDENGMLTGELAQHNPRLICVSPGHQFPSGVVMSLERRMKLLDIAVRQGAWILEDDYDSEFGFPQRARAPLRSLDFYGRVIYVGTFSQALFPSVRLGFIVCPPGIREDLCIVKRLDDRGCPLVEQAALAAFIRSRQFEKHVRRIVGGLEHRRIVFLDSLRRHCGERIEVRETQAGTHLVVWLQSVKQSQLTRLIELAAARNVGVYAIHPYYHRPPERAGLMLGYARLTADALERAGALLAECLEELEAEERSRSAEIPEELSNGYQSHIRADYGIRRLES